MLTVVQGCRRSSCDGRVRFTRRRWWLDNYLVVISVSRWASSDEARALADKLLEEYVSRVS